MKKHSLADLNEYLFDALDRLSNDDLEGDALKGEIDRANALTRIAERVIAGGDLALKALKLKGESLDADMRLPRLLDGSDDA